MIRAFLPSTKIFMVISRYLVAHYYLNRRVSSIEISSTFGLQHRQITPIMKKLVRVGLVKSKVGGLSPGYILGCDPKEIKVNDIITVLQGPLYTDGCHSILGESNNYFVKDFYSCSPERPCKLCRLVREDLLQFNRKLNQLSLYDLYEDSQKMYSIAQN